MSDLIKRSLHTFWQTFVVVFLGSAYDAFNAFQSNMNNWKSVLLALFLSSIAAALSAVKTFISNTK